jgi:carboxymethylenebutenolidase
MSTMVRLTIAFALGVLVAGVVAVRAKAGSGARSGGAAAPSPGEQGTLPAGANDAVARLNASPRHGEWVTVRAGQDSVRAWVVHPERPDSAPVVLVVHEIYGLSNWVRAVADQLAAEGFVAVAPDLLTMNPVAQTPAGEPDQQAASAAIRSLDRANVNRWLSAVAEWAMAQPNATDRYGIVGFCWGGGTSFAHAVAAPELDAAVVYYGPSPDPAAIGSIRAPVLGLYAGDDARINNGLPPVEEAMNAAGKSFEKHIYEGAGHGFLRQQDGREGANMTASQAAWPRTIEFFRQHLGG